MHKTKICTSYLCGKSKFIATPLHIIFLLVIFGLSISFQSHASSLCDVEKTKNQDFPGMLFTIKKNDVISAYVFGTLHKGYSRIPELPKPVERALSNSKKLYVEWAESDSPNGAKDRRAIFPDPQPSTLKLKSILNEDLYLKLSTHLDTLKLSTVGRADIETWHPSFLMSTLIDHEPVEMDKSHSLDVHLAFETLIKKIAIAGIETTSEHWKPLASFDNSDINAITAESMKEISCPTCIDERREFLLCSAEITRVGDPDQLVAMVDRFYENRPVAKEHMNRIGFSRNAGMTKKIASLLGKEPPFFVSVGALHLGGKIGIIQGLRDLGYTVEKVTE